jgi:hypothetical protein
LTDESKEEPAQGQPRFNEINKRVIYEALATLLTETEARSKKHAEMGEAIVIQISDVIKEFSKHKVLAIKKVSIF